MSFPDPEKLMKQILLSLKSQLSLCHQIVSNPTTDMETRTKWAHIQVQTCGVLGRVIKDMLLIDLKAEAMELTEEDKEKLERNIEIAKEMVKLLEKAESQSEPPSPSQPKKFRKGALKVLRSCRDVIRDLKEILPIILKFVEELLEALKE
jgi:hypothetical protein